MKLERTPYFKTDKFRRKLVNIGEIEAHFFFENQHFSMKIREIEADSFFENDRLRPKLLHMRFARATVAGPPGSNRPATLFMITLAECGKFLKRFSKKQMSLENGS